MSKLTNIIEKLKNLSFNSNCYYKHASAIIKGDKVLSFGYNSNKISFSRHAEVDACINYMYYTNEKSLKGLDLIVIRNNNKNEIRNSKPCKYCLDFMVKKQVRKIHYSNEDGYLVSEYIDNLESEHISAYYIYRRKPL